MMSAALFAVTENPPPPGTECLTLLTRDKVRLRAIRTLPGEARGTFVLLGGRGDFIERYFETTQDLLARGFAVVTLDMRGQGGSERLAADPYRDVTRSFREFDEDLRTLMEDAVLPHCPPPYYGLGHSTGGHVLLRNLRSRNWFSRAVLVSPLLGIDYGAWPGPAVSLLVTAMWLTRQGRIFLPGVRKRPFTRSDFPGNPLTSDKRRWMRDCATLEAAPQLGLGGPTFAWLRAARRSLREIARMRKPTAPVLIVAAGADRIVSNQAIREAAATIPGIALTMIPDAAHEILNERDDIRRQFLAALDSFIAP
jgi:lysophospholipase